ncbi:MAG: RDD family protein [Halofilum sp. (in: g-proteobacteria)]|nr:RDD family protein [Halofilum sp. (in: g-proteobacteria)]
MADNLQYAGIARRFAAAAVDLAILGAVVALVALQQPAADWPGMAMGLFVLGSALAMFYRMLSEGSSLQATPGKYLLGLRAIHPDGRTMMFVASALRSWPWWLTGAIGALAPALMPLAGALSLIALAPIVWDEQRRGLHDRMAGTVVVLRAREPQTGGDHV